MVLAQVAHKRGDVEAALDFARTTVQKARERCATDYLATTEFPVFLWLMANILGSLGRLDEATAMGAEWLALNPGQTQPLGPGAQSHQAHRRGGGCRGRGDPEGLHT
jgi:hypothetical protein